MVTAFIDLQRELEVATRLAREACEAILAVRDEARAGAQEKAGGQGPVTAADLAADEIVRVGLTSAFPTDVVITEETWVTDSLIEAGERVWFVDPLDGTQEFVNGTPDYAVMIGLVVGGQPVLGVVAQPPTGLLWRGVDGKGARLCERLDASGATTALDVRHAPVPAAGPRAAVSRSHPSRLTERVVKMLGGGTAVKKGSVGLKAALIVDGEADLYLSGSRRIKVWDTAGPEAILRAGGARMTALDGSPLAYVGEAAHGAGVRAWTALAERQLRDRVDEAVARWRAS
jgi:3'(2'), 5'-bisphosphate nucleotidase